jgi:hypothetical protein
MMMLAIGFALGFITSAIIFWWIMNKILDPVWWEEPER